MTIRTAALASFAFLALLPARAHADTKTESTFEHKPKGPNEKVSLQLDDTDLTELARVIGELTGKQFVVASQKLGKLKASVYSAQKLTVAEAYQAFLAVLQSNGLTVIPEGGFYKIVESQDVARQLTPIERGELPREERYVTRIHRLTHLSAEEVASDVLSKLATKDASIIPYPAGNLLIITETAANLRRMLEVLAAIDDAGEEDKLWMRPLKYVPSTQVEKQLDAILDLKHKAEVTSKGLHVGRIVALERPNAIVVVATKQSYERVGAIVDTIDIEPSNEPQVHVVMLQHSEAKKIVGPLNEAIGGGVPSQAPGKPGGSTPAAAGVLDAAVKIAADETTNSLVVTATNRDFASIKSVITELDRPKRQVYIEAVVLDVSTANGLDVGTAIHGGSPMDSLFGSGSQTAYGGWRPLSSASPGVGDLQAFALGVRGPDIPSPIPGVSTIPSFGGLLTAIAQTKGVDILSTPHILASDNTLAEIKVQLQTSLQPNAPQSSILSGLTGLSGTTNLASAASAIPNTGVSANYRPIGPKIKVTPHLNDSDEVRLDVDELISDVQSTPDKGDVYGTISYLERSAVTTLTVKDGETVVIGGLVRNRTSRAETKVPILGDIPLLGLLFRTRSDQTEKSNLLLILTPHIIRDKEDMKRIFERKMQERQELIDRETIFNGQAWKPPHDWKRTHGLLADIRLANLDVDKRRSEASALEEKPRPTPTPPPLDLPVPQGPGARTPSSSGGPSATPSAKPSVVER